MRLLVKQEEIKELQDNALKSIDKIKLELEEIKKLKEELNWEGSSYNDFSNNLDNTVNLELIKINKLEKLIKFLDEVILDYDLAQSNIDNEYLELLRGL